MLYIVSTPIGNLKDITLRALEVLKAVDFIVCEDTRQTNKLLQRYQIKKSLVSYHSYNKIQKTDFILDKLKSGKLVALVSDSGTPGISDPGNLIIRQAINRGIRVIPIPGPNAGLCALTVSGFPTDNFYFCGFLSPKPGRRKRELKTLKQQNGTVVLYEAPHRLLRALTDILEVLGDIEICVARELTKKFEEVHREKISRVLEHFGQVRPKGEFVLIFRPNKAGLFKVSDNRPGEVSRAFRERGFVSRAFREREVSLANQFSI